MTPWIIAAGALAYALLCTVSGFGKCRACKGKRQRKTLLRRRLRPCRHCKATGLRRRWGRSLYAWAKKTYRPLAKRRQVARSAA